MPEQSNFAINSGRKATNTLLLHLLSKSGHINFNNKYAQLYRHVCQFSGSAEKFSSSQNG